MIGAVPARGIGTQWDGWVRYEAAINDLYATLPVWSVCPYDTRGVSTEVLDDVVRTHPYLAVDGEHRPNPRYTEPTTFLTERARNEIDPLDQSRPDLTLTNPAPADGRRAVAALAATTELDRETIDGLMVGVSEALANAIRHGRPPVELRAWTAPDRALVVVRDQGSGPRTHMPGTYRGGVNRWTADWVCGSHTRSAAGSP